MTEEIKTYVRFFYKGRLGTESTIRPVDNRDPQKIQVPERAYGFSFFDRSERRLPNEEVIVENPINHSGIHYLGRVMAVEDAKREFPGNRTLLDEMNKNNLKEVVITRFGTIQPFGANDVIVVKK